MEASQNHHDQSSAFQAHKTDCEAIRGKGENNQL